MSNKDLAEGIKAMRKHVDALSDQSRHSIADLQARLDEALEELRTSLEELQVVEEELRAQNELLVQTRGEVEAGRQRYRDLFDFAPDGYIVTSVAGVIEEANHATGEMLRINRKYLIGKPFFSFIDEADRAELRGKLNQLTQAQSIQPEQIEVPIRARDGNVFQAAISLTPVFKQGGRPVGYRWILRDITRQKRAEEEVRRLNAELEQRVAQRTAELQDANRAKDELLIREQQARAEAESVNRSKDEFLAALSHELRTPINAILGWIHILRSPSADLEKRESALEVIDRNANTQARIIDDLLEVSRIITGNLHLEKTTISLKQVIQGAVESMQHLADKKQVSLAASLDSTAGLISGDPNRLQQVVLNLLSNAIKFTPPGGSVRVGLEQVDNYVRLSVIDTGQGIPPDFLPYIFDRFRQAESASTRRYGGLGLGLSIVHHLVKMHGGSVRAASEGEGKGATFTVDLPLTDGDRPATEIASWPRQVKAAPKAGAEPDLKDIWVIVIDDEQDAREMVKTVLQQWGAEVTALGTVAEVIDALSCESEGRRPDILVADIAMPGEDGYDLIRKVRKLGREQGGSIPAIALTAYASAEDRVRVLSEGYQMHAAKPVSLVELAANVERLARPDRGSRI